MPDYCKLCLINPPTQTGSHLLSAFMIEDMVGQRGKEISFLINASPNFEYRKDVGSEPILEDFILCRGCEQRMAYVESYVSSEYRDKIKQKRFSQNFELHSIKNSQYFITEALRLNNKAFLLFICTIVFRLSISSKEIFADFKLRIDEEEKLRSIVNETLPLYTDHRVKIKLKDWLRNLEGQVNLFDGLNYILATYNTLSDETRSAVFAHPVIRYPYNFLLSQVLLLFFFEEPYGGEILDVLKLTKELPWRNLLNNNHQNVNTLMVDEKKWLEILSSLKSILLNQKLDGIVGKFLIDFIARNGIFPNQQDWIKYYNTNFL